jgi:hypothetical protein
MIGRMCFDLPDVAGARGLLDVDDVEPAVEQLVDGRLSARAASLVNLVEQLDPNLLGILLRLTLGLTRGDGLAELDALARQLVDTAVHGDAGRAAGQPRDVAAGTAGARLRGRNGTPAAAVRSTNGSTSAVRREIKEAEKWL